jgi:hypothetical protein
MRPIRAPAKVHLEIDRLVLRGFAPDQRDALACGLRSELARLLADPVNVADLQARHAATLRGDALHMTARASPDALGGQAAQRVMQAIRGSDVVGLIDKK